MKKRVSYRVSILLLFFLVLHITTQKRISDSPILKPRYYPVKEVRYMHFGFNSLLADILWLRLVQNLDYCESENPEKAVNTGVGVDEILAHKNLPSRCNKGWVYQYLDLITDLAPRFRRVYRIGAEMLSIAVDDREGARLIFDKGLEQFPAYWELAYSASYHYLFEMQNPSRAADLLIQAADAGAPYWFRQMAGTLYTKAGQFVMAETILRKYIDEHSEDPNKTTERAQMRLKELNDLKEKIRIERLQEGKESSKQK